MAEEDVPQELVDKIRVLEMQLKLEQGDKYRPPTAQDLMDRRDVAIAFPQDKRNPRVSWEVHQVFMAVADPDERWRLVNSRDDWDVARAKRAVRRWEILEGDNWRNLNLTDAEKIWQAVDGERRLGENPDI